MTADGSIDNESRPHTAVDVAAALGLNRPARAAKNRIVGAKIEEYGFADARRLLSKCVHELLEHRLQSFCKLFLRGSAGQCVPRWPPLSSDIRQSRIVKVPVLT
jgi:hypothetical protein